MDKKCLFKNVQAFLKKKNVKFFFLVMGAEEAVDGKSIRIKQQRRMGWRRRGGGVRGLLQRRIGNDEELVMIIH